MRRSTWWIKEQETMTVRHAPGIKSLLHQKRAGATTAEVQSTRTDAPETKKPLVFVQSMAIFVLDCILHSQCG
jgi:hypothetical protein